MSIGSRRRLAHSSTSLLSSGSSNTATAGHVQEDRPEPRYQAWACQRGQSCLPTAGGGSIVHGGVPFVNCGLICIPFRGGTPFSPISDLNSGANWSRFRPVFEGLDGPHQKKTPRAQRNWAAAILGAPRFARRTYSKRRQTGAGHRMWSRNRATQIGKVRVAPRRAAG
jgi:hypothetical protein